MRLRWPVAIVLALMTGGRADATGQAPSRAQPQGATATGIIAGRVVDAVTGAPIDEAVVTFSGAPVPQGFGDPVTRRVMVDGQGRFAFGNLPPGRYSLNVDRFGYTRGAHGRNHPRAGSVGIDLVAGQRLLDAEILMWKLSAIGGRVTDEHGEPVTGVAVRILRRSYSSGRAQLVPATGAAFVLTDDRGEYRFGLLAAGEYAVFVPARVVTSPVATWTAQGVGRGEVFGAIAELSPLGSARNIQYGDFVVATMNSAPLPPAAVSASAMPVYRTTFHSAATTSQDAAIIVIAPGEERAGADIRLTPVQTSRVSGTITGPSGPMAAVSFRLMPAGSIVPDDSAEMSAASGVTDANGRFTLLGVPRGQYVFRVLSPRPSTTGEVNADKPALWVDEPVLVGSADINELNLTARQAPIIRGRVEFRGDRRVPPDQFTMIVEPTDPGPFRVANPRLDKDYAFTAELQPGFYTVTALPGSSMWCTSVRPGGRDISVDPIEIRDRNLTDVVITCGDEPTRLSGAVRDAKGNVDDDALVVFFPVDRRDWTAATGRPRRFGQMQASATGTFSLVGIPPGDYFVAALAPDAAQHWQDTTRLDVIARTATRLTLAPAAQRSLDLRTVGGR